MLWTLWFFALLGFYGLTTWLGALLQAKGFPVTKSVFYTIMISLAGIPGFLFSAWLVESWGRKGTLALNLIGGAIACYFYGGAADQTQLIVARAVHAVLPVRHVVGALRLYARALSDRRAGDRDRLRLRCRARSVR